MSHGPQETDSAEPNLMPLLDVVMQLLMFFVLCADLKQANRKNPLIALPPAAVAVPTSPSGDGMVYVNVKLFRSDDTDFQEFPDTVKETWKRLFPPPPENAQTICFIVPAAGNRQPMNKAEFESWLKNYVARQKAAAVNDKGTKTPEVTVALRASGAVQYQYILETLHFCSTDQKLKTVTSVNTRQRGNT